MPGRTRERVDAPVPDELRAAGKARGWPDGLLERALAAGIPATQLFGWLGWRKLDTADLEERIAWHERLTTGPLRGREATFADNDALCDLWENSPERLGDDLEVTALRGPNAFAQFQLQENVTLQVIADGNVLAAAVAWARRKVLVAGRRISVSYGQALRVHKDYRRMGLGDQVRCMATAVNNSTPVRTQYDYMRGGNFAVVGWWEKHSPGFWKDVPQSAGQVPGIPVDVLQVPAAPAASEDAAIRATRPEDLARCCELVNAAHGRHDLFRPYTQEFLENRLDEGYWGERALWYPSVYGWRDHFVLESRGRIVACAGLWDRGRDLRDRFRKRSTGEEHVVSHTALLDWGYEPGAEAAMLELIAQLVGRTHALGRTFLLAPVAQLPALARGLESAGPVPETRYLRWALKDQPLTRPYTDLAYW